MGLVFDTLAGEIPLVRRVWSAHCEATTAFNSVVKSSTLISFARYGHLVEVHVHGPESAATRMPCPEGWEFFGVELQPGAYLPLYPPYRLADHRDAQVPTPSGDRVVLDNQEWEMPTEQNVDVFVGRLAHAGLLVFDPLIDAIRHGERPRAMSERTAQLRFRRAVGISHRKFASIEQARRAARFLTDGGSIADAVAVGGYYDQPHLTRAMRWATRHTPAELRARVSPLAF
ncbi:helix-turn-helix domain-containing protein [Nocardia wallacei]|uniref:AraC family transcriptional regulator n=1 Tax=Nocardia wallacei TaxID=480035 RepID=A0A7G1KN32_9NOCA|nr:helix-turn-helix domain-containing protein [Nocardia wallacei]BCK56665.1 AraC family transcriptional regulator [Nocardia wallacei]